MGKRKTPGIREEFIGAEFGDARLSRRLVQLAEAIGASPEESFPKLFRESAELEAAYRFFSNDEVDPVSVLAPHVRATVARCKGQKVVAAHDTTVFTYTSGGHRTGLGSHRGAQEFRSHVTLAVRLDASRDPLGVLACDSFVRAGDGGDGSESRRWFDQAERVSQLAELDTSSVIHVMDREADDYRTFLDLKSNGLHFVVRAASDRVLVDASGERNGHIREALAAASVRTTREVPLTRRRAEGRTAQQKKTFPPRNARLASLNIAAITALLKRPANQSKKLPETCEVNLVRVWEPAPPKGETPVEWILITTEAIDTEAEVLEVVDAYRARWRIEEFFKALKSGCAYETRQLESFDALVNALAISLPIAWRLLRLRSLADDEPDAPADGFVDADEIAVLRAKIRKFPRRPTRRDALLAIAHLGGHLRRNGRPGWQTLRKGLDDLLMLVEGFRLAKKAKNGRYDQS